MKRAQVALIVVLSAGLLFFTAGSVNAESYPALPEALSALDSDDAAAVLPIKFPFALVSPQYFVFTPAGATPTKGFLFYPGGLVDPRAYAPAAHAIAAAGYLVVIVSMPFDLAPFGWKRGNLILRQFDWIKTWAIGGHSVGGSYACRFAKRYPAKVAGVVLWASWPSALFSLADRDIKAISIYGSKDGQPEEIEAGAGDLPPDAAFVKIEGGNHTQCGYYDTAPEPVQPGDNPATISRQEQQRQMIEATVGFLSGL